MRGWKVGSTVGRTACLGGAIVAACIAAGCTAESTRMALETQRRADSVQRAVFERQHDGLKVLLFREALRRMEACESAEQRAAVLNDVWNERDLIEFWALQHERAAALRVIGVDAVLYADQSIVDLLIKQIEAKGQRLEQGIAAAVGEGVESSEGGAR